MNDNVIPIGGRHKPVAMPVEVGKESYRSPARCTACGNEWVAVAPTGATQLECPECRTMRGLFVAPAHNYGGYRFFCAHCRGDAWSIEVGLFRCIACGATCSHESWANIEVPAE